MAAESTSATSPTNTTSPVTGPSSLGSPVVPTISEATHYGTSHDFNPSSTDAPSMPNRHPSLDSRHESPGSSIGRSFDEKRFESSTSRYGYSAQASATPSAYNPTTGAENGVATNGQHRQTSGPNRLSKPNVPKKERRGGFRNTIRRMFGRNSKARISMPTPIVYPHHNPEEFITSATAVDSKPQRAASVPTANPPRTSALSSHPPFRPTTVATSEPKFEPPPPERRPPERPPRPRSASVPSELLNREDVQAVEAALSDPGLQEKQEQNLEARNIGFAVTNGSNPKRRSRSVGAFPSVDHRMSPIQWHHIRRRSDEIKYWRESTPMAFYDTRNEPRPEATETSPEPVPGEEAGLADQPTEEPQDMGGRSQQFNFGLPGEVADLQNQEHIGLEERLVTLELKLMDFEYALSKIQAGSTLQSARNSFLEQAKQQASMDGASPTDAPQPQFPDSPGLQQPEGHKTVESKFSTDSDFVPSKARPTSVATTLKPNTHQGTYTSAEKPPNNDRRQIRSSLSSLSIEHYTALITLVRHEQSARQRLEEQVNQLQAQVDQLSTQPRHSRNPSSSQHSHTLSQSSQQRRHGMVEPDSHSRRRRAYLPERPRSSSYDTDPTDTDDEAYHDAYVTPSITPMEFPAERGEYERGAFERISVEEGVAF